MPQNLRTRHSAAAKAPATAADTVLHTLEEFQARLHSDPNDKPDTPPARDPSESRARTLSWDEIPGWQKDNEFILTGYRRIQNSWLGCAASVFGFLIFFNSDLHNETVNIHSHLFGALLFCWLLVSLNQTYLASYPTVSWKDAAVFSIFLASAVICMFLSAFYHTCGVHSKGVAARCNALDYTGIVVLTVGSFYPCIYYGFYCAPHFQKFYLTLISLAGIGAAYIVINPEYRKPSHRGARTKVFIALGLCGVVPVTHGLAIHGAWRLCYEMGFGWLLASAMLYISGALLYANRIPERFSPGRFDYFFASHQIFHFHVLWAALAHYRCILIAFDYCHAANPVCAL